MAKSYDKRHNVLYVRSNTMILTDKEVEAILKTLDSIEVKGFDNMDKLMGLMQFFKNKQKEEKEDA